MKITAGIKNQQACATIVWYLFDNDVIEQETGELFMGNVKILPSLGSFRDSVVINLRVTNNKNV